MKHKHLAAVLSLSMIASMTSPIYASSATGEIQTNLLFENNDTESSIESRNIALTLYKGDTEIGRAYIDSTETTIGGYPLTITGGAEDKLYQIHIGNLPQGDYQIKLTGKYHAEYTSDTISLDSTNKQVNVSSSSQSFAYGDVNGDNTVDEQDLETLKTQILAGQNTMDLSGDGKVDITDLTIVHMNLASSSSASILETSFLSLASVVNTDAMTSAIEETLTVTGDVADIFTTGNTNTVQLTSTESITTDTPLSFPIVLEKETAMAEIQLTTPVGEGSIQTGYVTVEYIDEDGKDASTQIYFDENNSSPMTQTLAATTDYEVATIEETEAPSNVVVISLGSRVVVKTITVTVTAVESAEGTIDYVALQEVNFVVDMVPEDPQASNGLVENVKATTGAKSVSLSWDLVPNVSGYRVSYGTASGKYTSTVNVTGNSATISGLENFTTYYMVVQSTHGDWSSSYSTQVTVTPVPSSAPSATTLLSATPIDQGANIRWQSNQDASSYSVYMKETDSNDSYTLRATSTGTEVLVGELSNEVEYSVYVVCSNSRGDSAPSNILTVTPEKENIEGPTLPNLGRLPLSAVTNITMDNTSNVKESLYPNGWDISHVYDGDYATDWVADVWYKSSGFTFTFDQAYDMSYLAYVAKVDGLYHASLDRVSYAIWVEGDDVNDPAGYSYTGIDYSIKYTDANGQNYCVVDFPRNENIIQIKVAAAQWDGSYTNVSISELVFYEHNSINEDVQALFGNNNFTTLRQGVTQAEIDALRERINGTEEYIVNPEILSREVDMAEAILQGDPLTGYMKTNLTSIDNSADDRGLSNISPLGVVAYANNNITIYADIPEGETVTLYPSQYFAEPFQQTGTGIELVSGRNIIYVEQLTYNSDVSKGGVLYYSYTGDKGDEISLHIDSWYPSSGQSEIWQVPVLELYDMYSLTETEIKARITTYIEQCQAYSEISINNPAYNPLNATEVSLRNVLLSLPFTEFYGGLSGSTTAEQVEAMYQNILAWEELHMVCNVAYGLDNWENPREGRQNIRYMRMSDAFMYAAGNHIGIQYGSVASLAKGIPTSSGGSGFFGWGIAHEIGHNLDRMGRAEITNNIYSLLAQMYDGGTSYGNTRISEGYEAVYSKVTSGNMGIANNVFTQLAMYWQLQQAYCGENFLEFYNLVNKEYKANAYSSYSNETRFALIVSSVVQKDLSDFFTAWGVDFSDSAKAEMAKYTAESRKIQYLNDSSREYRLTDGTGASNLSFSLTVEATDSNREFTLTANNSNTTEVQGYEVYRNGTLVGFTTTGVYVDNVGSLNNTAIQYAMVAVDKLGNVASAQVKAEEIRIEYDSVIDSALYTVEVVEGGLKYTFTDATATSGILVSNAPTTGDFTVKVLLEDTETTIEATTEENTEITTEENTEATTEENTQATTETNTEEIPYSRLATVYGELQSQNHTHTEDCGCELPVATVTLSVGTLATGNPEDYSGYLTVKQGDFTQNQAQSQDKFINYFQKQGVDTEDTRIGTYDAEEIVVLGENLNPDDIQFLSYIGDNVWFMEQSVGKLAEDFDVGDGSTIPAGTIIAMGEYIGDPYFNEITMMGRFLDDYAVDGSEISYVERAFSGTTYLFGYDTETVSTISDGLFLFVPDTQTESGLQGLENGTDCLGASVFPVDLKAVMVRTTNTGSYQSSDTIWTAVASEDSMPLVYIQ